MRSLPTASDCSLCHRATHLISSVSSSSSSSLAAAAAAAVSECYNQWSCVLVAVVSDTRRTCRHEEPSTTIVCLSRRQQVTDLTGLSVTQRRRDSVKTASSTSHCYNSSQLIFNPRLFSEWRQWSLTWSLQRSDNTRVRRNVESR